MATSTLAPYLQPPNTSLSGGNLTLTKTTNNTTATLTATTLLGQGKWYWEQTLGNVTSGVFAVGFLLTTYLNWNDYLGDSYFSLGYRSDGGVWVNNNSITTIQTYTTGDVISVAVDLVNELVWFRKNGGNWNNSGTANPATGAGGISIPNGAALGGIFPAVGVYAVGDSVTINLGGSTFAYTAPSGFAAANTWSVPSAKAAVKAASWYTSTMTYRNYSPLVGGFYSYRTWSPAGTEKFISGTVKEGSTPVAKYVFLYDTVTGEYLGRVLSNGGSGAFSLSGVGRSSVFAVAFDPTTYQAEVYDRLTPV